MNQHQVHPGPREPEVPLSDVSAWRAIVRVLRSTAVGTADSLISVILPADCRVCGLPLDRFTLLPVCSACWNDLPSQTGTLCTCCGEALDLIPPLDGKTLCRPCRISPPDFQKAVAHGIYHSNLRSLLHLLKYDGIERLAKRLGELLADQVLAIPGLPTNLLVVPVPLYRKKRRTRGFNQSELLAKGVIAALRHLRPEMQIRLASPLLHRQRDTESQAALTPHQRRENVRGAFFVPHPDSVTGRNILLIDDIYTTGATARACSRALRRAGAASIWVATVARAQREFMPAPEVQPLTEPAPAPSELPMDKDFVFWEEDRTVSTGGNAK